MFNTYEIWYNRLDMERMIWMQVKNRLKEILDERGMKQNFVAEKAGITRQTFSNLVNNRFNPSLELAFKICNVLELSLDQVFYYE